MLPEFAAGAPVQAPFRNQSMFTFPVGTACAGLGSGFGEPTVTKSCTVVPTATAVTVELAAFLTSVVAWDGRFCSVTVAGACAWLFASGLQLLPLPGAHCQVKSSESLSLWVAVML